MNRRGFVGLGLLGALAALIRPALPKPKRGFVVLPDIVPEGTEFKFAKPVGYTGSFVSYDLAKGADKGVVLWFMNGKIIRVTEALPCHSTGASFKA